MSQSQTGTVSYSFPELMTIFVAISDEAFLSYYKQWRNHPDAAEYLAELRAKKDLMPHVGTVARENDWPKLYELPENIATNINKLIVDTYTYDQARMQKMLLVLGYLRTLLQEDLNALIFALQDSESNQQPIQRPTVEEPVSASSEAHQKQPPVKPIPRYAFQEAIPGTSSMIQPPRRNTDSDPGTEIGQTKSEFVQKHAFVKPITRSTIQEGIAGPSGISQRTESNIDTGPGTKTMVKRTGRNKPRHTNRDNTRKLVPPEPPKPLSKEELKYGAIAERLKEEQLKEKQMRQNQEREHRAVAKRLKEEQLKEQHGRQNQEKGHRAAAERLKEEKLKQKQLKTKQSKEKQARQNQKKRD